MQITNVMEDLEATVLRVPEKIAFSDDVTELTFADVYHESRSIGSFLHSKGQLYGVPYGYARIRGHCQSFLLIEAPDTRLFAKARIYVQK